LIAVTREGDRGLHEVERVIHEVERVIHEVERVIHEVERVIHEVERVIHEVERVIQRGGVGSAPRRSSVLFDGVAWRSLLVPRSHGMVRIVIGEAPAIGVMSISRNK
jgi:hypothetical protein